MLQDLLLLLVLAFLGACGARVARRACLVEDSALAVALGLPLGLSVVILVAGVLARLVPLSVCLVLAVLLAGAAAWACPSPSGPSPSGPSSEAEPFRSGHRWILGFVLAASVLYLHTSQLARPEDDFWIHYPVTRSLLRGNIPPVNPYFPDLPLQGHYGRHLLLATMSLPEGGDTLRTQWILELVLMVNSVVLWAAALRLVTGSALAGTLGTLLVFLGVNVGSRVGLLDAYDNNNLLVYLLLAVLLALLGDLLARAAHRLPVPPLLPVVAGVVAGVYGAVYETHFALVLGSLVLSGAVVAFFRRGEGRRVARAVLLVLLVSTPLAVVQGGTLQNLAWKTLRGASPEVRSAGELNQSQEVTIRFPKDPILTIRLGADVYQRLSFAMDTALFRRYQPVLDEGGEANVFGPRVLVLHWLPTWLAPLTLAWAFWRRSLGGLFLGSFAILSYLVPALVDFGSVHEMEYFRWEFAAGVGFAALLGMALADAWKRRSSGFVGAVAGTALVLLILVDLVGAQRRLNDLAIELQQSPDLVARTLTPWYPSTDRWFLDQAKLGLTSTDLEVARRLWRESRLGDRLLTGFRSTGHESMLWEAAMAGLSGTFTVGHALPPPWLPVGVAPYLPAQPTVAYRQTGRTELLAGLGVDWILVAPSRGETSPAGMEPADQAGAGEGLRLLYRVDGVGPGLLELSSSPLEVTARVEGVPGPLACQSGVAYPVRVRLSQPLKGWLAYVQRSSEGVEANRLAPVTVRVDGSEVETWYVPPLEEGGYELTWAHLADGVSEWRLFQGTASADYRFSEAVYDRLRVERSDISEDQAGVVTLFNVGSLPFDTGAPVRLQWWVWDPQKHAYRIPFLPEGEEVLDLRLPPGGSLSTRFRLASPVPGGGRVDFSVAARVGPPVPVSDIRDALGR